MDGITKFESMVEIHTCITMMAFDMRTSSYMCMEGHFDTLNPTT